MADVTVTDVKNDIHTAATSHVFEAIQYMDAIHTDMDEEEIKDLIRQAADRYQFDGINTSYEAFLIVGSSQFPNAENTDFDGLTSSLDCLNQEANDIAYQVYYEFLHDEISEVLERIMAIQEKAIELGYDGKFQMSGSSCYGWEAHNYETDCGICIWSDEKNVPYAYNPSLLEGELWAIEGEVNGLHMGACWAPEGNS